MAKSTSSSAACCRIGIQPPGRKTSGARPSRARGVCSGSSDIAVDPACRSIMIGFCFRGLPRVTVVETKAHIASRAGRATPPDLVPCSGVRVVSEHNIVRGPLPEKIARLHASPFGPAKFAILHPAQERILLVFDKPREMRSARATGLGIDSFEAEAPGLAFPRHATDAIAIRNSLVQLAVDERRHRNLSAVTRLRYDARGERANRFELIGREE